MPGIFGFYKKHTKIEVDALSERIITAMNPTGNMRVDQHIDAADSCGLGRVSLGILNAVDQPVKSVAGDCPVVFHGELYGRNGASSDPEFLLKRYIKKGDACADGLNGIFHFAVIDLQQHKIKLVQKTGTFVQNGH